MITPEAIQLLMENWNRLHRLARQQNPGASEESLYQLTKAAMNRAIPIH